MADTSKDVEENPIQGLSVVDSVNVTSTNPTEKTDGDTVKTEENGKVTVKVEANHNDTANDDEKNSIGDSNCEKGLDEEEDEVTIVLDAEDRRDTRDVDDKDSTQTTLVITTEDLLESTTLDDVPTNTEEAKVKEEKKPIRAQPSSHEVKKKPIKPRSKGTDSNYFWVSNITRQVKATDLKKFFSQIGKVLTAKILTNGNSYFGYVSVESAGLAIKCIKQLNNSVFEGKKILVTKDRPDLREAKTPAIKPEPKRKRVVKIEPKKEEKPVESKSASVESKEKKSPEEHPTKCNSIIADLKKKLNRCKTDVSTYKFKVLEYQRRHDGMRKKCDSLERELKEMQYKQRSERRRLNQEREQFEKTKKLEQIRFDADRAIINKELDEVKKLREHLKEKIDEFKTQTKKAAKRRSRSPPIRVRNVRGRSPALRNNNANNGFRPEDRVEKKRKREDLSRGRTPPPPPKLSEVVGKKRSDRGPDSTASNRPYFGDVEKRLPSLPREYDYRHKSSYLPPDEIRGAWPNPFPKDPRRVGAGPSGSQNYPPDMRYGGGGYQFTPSSISGPPRNYYPEFGKPYGPY